MREKNDSVVNCTFSYYVVSNGPIDPGTSPGAQTDGHRVESHTAPSAVADSTGGSLRRHLPADEASCGAFRTPTRTQAKRPLALRFLRSRARGYQIRSAEEIRLLAYSKWASAPLRASFSAATPVPTPPRADDGVRYA